MEFKINSDSNLDCTHFSIWIITLLKLFKSDNSRCYKKRTYRTTILTFTTLSNSAVW